MQSEKHIIVLKFGSSVLRSESDLPTAVHEIYRWWREGYQVVLVVSAFGNTTDELTQRAHSSVRSAERRTGRGAVGHRRSRFIRIARPRIESIGNSSHCARRRTSRPRY